MIKDDGNIIKGLGFVVMHSAHLERKIDDLLFMLSSVEDFSQKDQRKPISQKLKNAKKFVAKLNGEYVSELIEDLGKCEEHFEWRNELVHGRIYSSDYHEENLKSGRPNIPDRPVSSKELYLLANNLVALKSSVYRPMILEIPNELASRQTNA